MGGRVRTLSGSRSEYAGLLLDIRAACADARHSFVEQMSILCRAWLREHERMRGPAWARFHVFDDGAGIGEPREGDVSPAASIYHRMEGPSDGPKASGRDSGGGAGGGVGGRSTGDGAAGAGPNPLGSESAARQGAGVERGVGAVARVPGESGGTGGAPGPRARRTVLAPDPLVDTLGQCAAALGVSLPTLFRWRDAGCDALNDRPIDTRRVTGWRARNLRGWTRRHGGVGA